MLAEEEKIIVVNGYCHHVERMMQLSRARKACCWSSTRSCKLVLVMLRGGCWSAVGGEKKLLKLPVRKKKIGLLLTMEKKQLLKLSMMGKKSN